MKMFLGDTEKEKKFAEQFNNNVVPQLKAFEVLRKRINNKYKKILSITISISLILVLMATFYIITIGLETGWVFVLSYLTPFVVVALIYIPLLYRKGENKEFITKLKEACFKPLLNTFGSIGWVDYFGSLSDFDLENSGLFATFNKRVTDDEFYGTYKDIKFKTSETYLTKESGSGKSRTCTVVFKGIVLEFKVSKRFNCPTVVSTKGDLTQRDDLWVNLFAFAPLFLYFFLEITTTNNKTIMMIKTILALLIIGILIIFLMKYTAKPSTKKIKKIILEDVKFSKKYHVYSSDQVEARCVVTPAFMEKFLNLKTSFGAKNAKCAFYDNKIMIAIATNQNFFEIGNLDNSLLETESFEYLFDEISAIYDIMDYFKINNY